MVQLVLTSNYKHVVITIAAAVVSTGYLFAHICHAVLSARYISVRSLSPCSVTRLERPTEGDPVPLHLLARSWCSRIRWANPQLPLSN